MKTRNEKILVLILALIVFVGGNFYGYRWLAARQSALEMQEHELRADNAEAAVDLQKEPLWAQRKKWIAAHQPVFTDEGEAKAQVLRDVLKGARDHHLAIVEENLDETVPGVAGTRIGVVLKVKGGMQDLCQWLAEVQSPESFYAVGQLSLRADDDQKSMVCSLKLGRYFRKG